MHAEGPGQADEIGAVPVDTAARQPGAVLVDDGGYGMLRYDQEREGLPRRGVDWDSPDFVGLARSFGVHADRVSGFGRAFRRLLGEFVESDEPNVLVVKAKLKPPLNTSPRWYRK